MKRQRRRNRLLWLLPLLLALLVLDGQSRLVVNKYSAPVSGLPADFEGLRIVQLSDLHGAEFGRENQRLLRTVEKCSPHVIFLTGDFVEKVEDLTVTAQLLPELVKIAPCYFVSGNHEWASGCAEELAKQLELAGVRYLRNEYEPLRIGQSEILLCGVEDPNSWADLTTPDTLVEEARSVYPGLPVVLLGHRNYWIEKYPALPVELILCGHGHGGIIRIPGVGGLVGTDRLLFPQYTEGQHESGSYSMIVSRGLGKIRGIPRVFNNPEIVLITLNRAA